MGSLECKASDGVTEPSPAPRRGVVAELAGCRKPCCGVVRVVSALVIL
jgi:hypothetical protein